MIRKLIVALFAFFLIGATPVEYSFASSHSSQSSSHKKKRSKKAKDAFRKSHPCPSTGKKSGKCPGYVIDHITPLKRGGADSPDNMQWQTKADAKAKDKWE